MINWHFKWAAVFFAATWAAVLSAYIVGSSPGPSSFVLLKVFVVAVLVFGALAAVELVVGVVVAVREHRFRQFLKSTTDEDPNHDAV